MKRISRSLAASGPSSGDPQRPSRSEAGDTLIEVLLTLVVLGIASVGILAGFATTISASADHRSQVTLDTVLRSSSELVFQKFQQAGTFDTTCNASSTNYPGINASLTTYLTTYLAATPGYTASITNVAYWSSSLKQFIGSPCPGSATPQLITVTVSGPNGTGGSVNVAVNDNNYVMTSAPPASSLADFSVTPSTYAPTAGVPFTVTVTAYDQFGQVYTGYTGPECLTFSGPAASPNNTLPSYPSTSPCASGSAVAFSQGVTSSAVPVTLYNAESPTLSVTDNSSGKVGATSLTVGPAAAQTMTIVQGNNQSANLSTAFGTALEVNLIDSYGNPVPSVSVTFAAPGSGASGTFGSPCSGVSCVVSTGASGNATAPIFTANATSGGPYTVTATAGALTQNFSLTNGSVVKGIAVENVTGASGTALSCTGLGTSSEVCNVGSGSNNTMTVQVAFVNSSGTSTIYSATVDEPVQYQITGHSTSNGNVTITHNQTTSTGSVTSSMTGSNSQTITFTFNGTWTATITLN